MNITIRLTKVEYEMLKELQKRDKRYCKGIAIKLKTEIRIDHASLAKVIPCLPCRRGIKI